MNLEKVFGRRRQRISQPNLARHARKCIICHHKDRPAVDYDYLNWRSTRQIVNEYALPHRTGLHRMPKLRASPLCANPSSAPSSIP
jgi:hypothetical protein